MEFTIAVSGVALVSKTIINKQALVKYCIRRETDVENDTGWIFFSQKDKQRGNLKLDDFEVVPFVDLVEKVLKIVSPLYNMPVGTDVQFLVKWGRPFFADSVTGNEIDIEKYVTLPIGSPIELAFVEKKGFLKKIFS